MEKRKLGRSGIEISPFCLGGNVFGWTLDESTSFRILDAFVDSGFDFVDTADVYSRWKPGNSGGESETILGNWFRRSGKTCSIGETVANCAAAARPTASNVSPVESDTRCR